MKSGTGRQQRGARWDPPAGVNVGDYRTRAGLEAIAKRRNTSGLATRGFNPWSRCYTATKRSRALRDRSTRRPWFLPNMPDPDPTPPELADLNSAVRTIEVKGQRLPDAVLLFSGVEGSAEAKLSKAVINSHA